MRADVRGRGERFWIFTRDVHRRCLQTKKTILEEIEAVITDDNIYEMPEILMSELWNHGGSHRHRPSRSYKIEIVDLMLNKRS